MCQPCANSRPYADRQYLTQPGLWTGRGEYWLPSCGSNQGGWIGTANQDSRFVSEPYVELDQLYPGCNHSQLLRKVQIL